MSALQLKTLRENVNWKIEAERREFFRKFRFLVRDWDGELPNLQDIFRKEEIDWLLFEDVKRENRECLLVDFVVRAGYKDKPNVDEDGKPFLHCTTALHGTLTLDFSYKMNTIRQLFEVYDKFEVNYIDDLDRTHFHVACTFGCEDIVEQFLDLGQDPNLIWPGPGNTPLICALNRGHKPTARLLLRRGADQNLANNYECTPLHKICFGEDDDLVELFFKINDDQHQTVQIEAKDELGRTPLHVAMWMRNKKAVESLLKRGANPNSTDNKGLTPLHTITDRNKIFTNFDYVGVAQVFFDVNEKVNQLVQIDALDNLGRTPLQSAVENLWPNIIDVLLDHGADLSSFVFPTEINFQDESRIWNKPDIFKLRSTSSMLAVVEGLQNRGYELYRSDLVTIMKTFHKHDLFEKSKVIENNWYDDEKFTEVAKTFMMNSSLSLYDLIRLRPKEAAKRLTASDCYKLAHRTDYFLIPCFEACFQHLRELILRRFLQRWAQDCFWELIHYRLPILCCDMIIEGLTNKDLCNIILATADQRS